MRWLLWLFIGLFSSAQAWAAGQVHIVLSDAGETYEATAASFVKALEADKAAQVWRLAELRADEVDRLTGEPNLMVPIGLRASRFVAEHHAGIAPVLSLLIPMNAAQRLRWPETLRNGKVSSVYIDQPIGRSLALIEAMLPLRTRVGILSTPDHADALKALEREAGNRGMSIVASLVDDPSELGARMRQVLSQSDVLLLRPDAWGTGGGNLRGLLLASYRMRVPVIGFSPGLVKAGAVAAVFASPEQIGRQGGQMARRWQATGGLPAPQYSGQFSVDVNDHVARSLGLAVPLEDELLARVGASD